MRMWRILNGVAAVCFVALAIVVIPTFFDPEFEVVNHASETVSVTALWREYEKAIGDIRPGAARRFSVSDEAAMVFRVSYPSGRIIESEPIYFSRGFEIFASITDRGVEVYHDFERPASE